MPNEKIFFPEQSCLRLFGAAVMMMLCFSTLQAQKAPELVQDINTAPNSIFTTFNQSGLQISPMIVFNGKLYFNGTESAHGVELWQYDGSSAPASMVYDMDPGHTTSSGALFQGGICNYNGKLYYCGGTHNTGYELVACDGVNPPVITTDLNPGARHSWPRCFTAFKGNLFFSADTTNIFGIGYAPSFYRYDGVHRPRRISIGTETVGGNGSSAQEFTPYDTLLYFLANPSTSTDRYDLLLYHTDQYGNYAPAKGTAGLSHLYGLMVSDPLMYFVAYTPAHGFELYSYNGDTALRVTDVGAGPVNGLPKDTLWQTAGRASNIYRLTFYNGALYFPGSTTGINYQLYKYDLHSRATSLVATLHPDTLVQPHGLPLVPNSFHVYDGSLFFAAYTLATGYELWKWDGTSCGLFADIHTGHLGSIGWVDDDTINGWSNRNVFNLPYFTEYKGQLYFGAMDSLHGRELWRMGTQTNGITQATWPGAVKVYPNPAKSDVVIEISVPSNQLLSLFLTDARGRVVYRLPTKDFETGTTRLSLPLHNLVAGSYYYRLTGSDGQTCVAGVILCL